MLSKLPGIHTERFAGVVHDELEWRAGTDSGLRVERVAITAEAAHEVTARGGVALAILGALLARVQSSLDLACPIASEDEADFPATIVAVGKEPDFAAAELAARNTHRVPTGKLCHPRANSNRRKRHGDHGEEDGRRYHCPPAQFDLGAQHRR